MVAPVFSDSHNHNSNKLPCLEELSLRVWRQGAPVDSLAEQVRRQARLAANPKPLRAAGFSVNNNNLKGAHQVKVHSVAKLQLLANRPRVASKEASSDSQTLPRVSNLALSHKDCKGLASKTHPLVVHFSEIHSNNLAPLAKHLKVSVVSVVGSTPSPKAQPQHSRVSSRHRPQDSEPRQMRAPSQVVAVAQAFSKELVPNNQVAFLDLSHPKPQHLANKISRSQVDFLARHRKLRSNQALLAPLKARLEPPRAHLVPILAQVNRASSARLSR